MRERLMIYYSKDKDNHELSIIYYNYSNDLENIDKELSKYDYYDYMTDDEKFNIKRRLYEDKNRIFKRNAQVCAFPESAFEITSIPAPLYSWVPINSVRTSITAPPASPRR